MNITKVNIPETNYTKQAIEKQGVVMHWMAGTIESASNRFSKPNTGVSAHYGIADDYILQWVEDGYIAHHTGVWSANCQYIGIEHEGGYMLENGERKKPTDKTHETSALLLAKLSRRHGWGGLKFGKNVFIHSEFKNTQCPGTLDVQGIIYKANKILNNDDIKKEELNSIVEALYWSAKVLNNNDMKKEELKAIVEALYWSVALRKPDQEGVQFWLDEYDKEVEKSIWANRIIEGFRKEKTEQGIEFLDASKNQWRSKEDILNEATKVKTKVKK